MREANPRLVGQECVHGQTAGEIAQCYPHLALSQIYAALAYFHANRDEIEAELATDDAEFDELKQRTD